MALTTPDGVTLEARVAEAPGRARGRWWSAIPIPSTGATWTTPWSCAPPRCAPISGWPRCGSTSGGWAARRARTAAGSPSASTSRRPSTTCAGIAAHDVGVALVGYSFGALVAAHVAAGRPEVAGLCLIAPPLGLAGGIAPAGARRVQRTACASWSAPGTSTARPRRVERGAAGIPQRSADPRGGRESLLPRQALPPGRGRRHLGARRLRAPAPGRRAARSRDGRRARQGNRGSFWGVAVPAEKMMRMPSSMPTPV